MFQEAEHSTEEAERQECGRGRPRPVWSRLEHGLSLRGEWGGEETRWQVWAVARIG